VDQHSVIGRIESEIRNKLEQVVVGLGSLILASQTEEFVKPTPRCSGIQLNVWAAIENEVVLASAFHAPSPFEKS
jgi:hypothetical protein